ncbi:MAG: hypothetical protein KAI29_11150, partial [Cyclobacteriaceae bacterium]|nr:hypothetical protein [Cyclobacteriaceae bacterium]
MQNPYRKKRFKEFTWITLIGFAIFFMLCPQCFISIVEFFKNWHSLLLCLLYTYILGYGSTFISIKIEKIYSWLEHPRKKFFLHFVTLAVFSLIVSALLFYAFAYLL